VLLAAERQAARDWQRSMRDDARQVATRDAERRREHERELAYDAWVWAQPECSRVACFGCWHRRRECRHQRVRERVLLA
jgi:hypothetical protein